MTDTPAATMTMIASAPMATTGRGRPHSGRLDGWVIRAVWLVFLVFPVITLVSSDLSWWQVGIGLVLVGAFTTVLL